MQRTHFSVALGVGAENEKLRKSDTKFQADVALEGHSNGMKIVRFRASSPSLSKQAAAFTGGTTTQLSNKITRRKERS